MSKDAAVLVLRLVGFGLALSHGWGKVAALATGGGDQFIAGVEALGFPMPGLFAWASALAEFAGGLCVALGLGARIAASVAAFNMFVAGFMRHRFHLHLFAWLGLGGSPEAVAEKYGNPELAIIYLLCFVSVILLGSGRLSLDHLLFKRGK